jgi:HKD family nuclease
MTARSFHAKAYITHAKLEVVGSQALVGSSNFTAPGLTKNIELNIQVRAREKSLNYRSGSKRTGTTRAK